MLNGELRNSQSRQAHDACTLGGRSAMEATLEIFRQASLRQQLPETSLHGRPAAKPEVKYDGLTLSRTRRRSAAGTTHWGLAGEDAPY